MGLLAARSRFAAGLLAATALMLLVAATIVCAAWLHSQAVPSAAIQSLQANTTAAQQTITITVVDRQNDDVETVADYLADVPWPVSVVSQRTEIPQARQWPLVEWTIRPELAQLDPANLGTLTSVVREVESGQQVPRAVRIDSELGDLLAATQRQSVTVRSSIYVVAVATALLAGLTLTLSAQLVAASRERELRLLRARGYSTGQLFGVTAAEALLVAAPAALLAPLLAATLMRALGAGGVLHPATWLVSTAVALAGVLATVLVLQSVSGLVTGGQGAVTSDEVEPTGRAALLRSGLDALIIVLAGLACWQLLRYGSPVRALADGSLGIDPLIVVAPALVLLAGALLALRVLLWTSRRLDGPATASNQVSAPLGVWQVARRPSRHAGPAMLLVLSIALGALSTTYAASWARSQTAQADLAAGADLRISASPTPIPGLAGLATSQAVTQLPGVASALAVLTAPVPGELPSLQMLAWDAVAAEPVVQLRDDLVTVYGSDGDGLAAATAALIAERPDVPAIDLPDGTTAVDVALVDADRLPGDLVVNLVLRDAAGVLHRTPRVVLSEAATTGRVSLPITPGRLSSDAEGIASVETPSGIDGFETPLARLLNRPMPLAVLAVELEVPATATPLTLDLSLDAVLPDGAEVALSAPAAWRGIARGGVTPTVADLTPGTSSLLHFEITTGPNAATIALLPASSDDARAGSVSGPPAPPVLPVLGTFPQREALRATIAGQTLQIQSVGQLSALPGEGLGAATRSGFIVDAPTMTQALYEARGTVLPVSAWWVELDGTTSAAKTASAQAASDALADVPGVTLAADRLALARGLATDPLGAIVVTAGHLALIAAVTSAAIGVAVGAAVAIRERRRELAFLRALGVGPRQFLTSLAVEQGLQYVVAAVLGSAVGIAMAAILLPRLLVDARGLAPRPSAQLAIGWPALALLWTLVAAAAALSIALIARRLHRAPLAATLRADVGGA